MLFDRKLLDDALAGLEPKVRAAMPEDADAVASLLHELAIREWNGPVAGMRENVGKFLTAPSSSIILVVEHEHKVSGFVVLHTYPGVAEGAPVLYLDDIYVDEGLQNRGLGSALMSGVECVAAHVGACYVSLQTRRQNHAAHRFYERHGFTFHDDVVFEREIDASPET
ncbi:MAG: GNAT family N-acetyltransferase [Planctomycetaceae bacterium]